MSAQAANMLAHKLLLMIKAKPERWCEYCFKYFKSQRWPSKACIHWTPRCVFPLATSKQKAWPSADTLAKLLTLSETTFSSRVRTWRRQLEEELNTCALRVGLTVDRTWTFGSEPILNQHCWPVIGQSGEISNYDVTHRRFDNYLIPPRLRGDSLQIQVPKVSRAAPRHAVKTRLAPPQSLSR